VRTALSPAAVHATGDGLAARLALPTSSIARFAAGTTSASRVKTEDTGSGGIPSVATTMAVTAATSRLHVTAAAVMRE